MGTKKLSSVTLARLRFAEHHSDARELLWSVMFGNEQQRPIAACQSLASCSTFKKSP
jgi:hypothetical protein